MHRPPFAAQLLLMGLQEIPSWITFTIILAAIFRDSFSRSFIVQSLSRLTGGSASFRIWESGDGCRELGLAVLLLFRFGFGIVACCLFAMSVVSYSISYAALHSPSGNQARLLERGIVASGH